jgi:hypothetical protein
MDHELAEVDNSRGVDQKISPDLGCSPEFLCLQQLLSVWHNAKPLESLHCFRRELYGKEGL